MSRGVIVVTGGAGMLGRRLMADARAAGWDPVSLDIAEADLVVDLTDAAATAGALRDAAPRAVIHGAAWTDVERAEDEEPAALRLNGEASGNVAAACRAVGARLVAVSTDYVFDGALTGRPYVESDDVAPLSAYGRTKLAGEQAIAAATDDYVIARTAWLYGFPGKSLADTLLRIGAERGEVAVVTDQTGSPTWTGHLAPALLELAGGTVTGLAHLAGSGRTTWHGLICEVFAQAGLGATVLETDSTAFVQQAQRPAWSVLATERSAEGVPVLPDWREGVAGFLAERAAKTAKIGA